MIAYPESPHLFVAQAATYVEYAPIDQHDAIFNRLGRNALGNLAEYFRNQPAAAEGGVTYATWLAEADESLERYVAENAASLEAFSVHFEAPLQALQSELATMRDKRQHEDYLGAGYVSRAYMLGADHVVRMRRRNNTNTRRAEEINSYVGSLLPGRFTPNLEHLAGHSYHRGVTVSEHADGKRLGLFGAEDVPHVTDQQILDALVAVESLQARGLRLDPKFGNVLYDRQKGFTILDYNADWDARFLPDDDVTSFVRLLAYGGIYPCKIESEADIARLLSAESARRPLLLKAQAIILARYPGDTKLATNMQKFLAENSERQEQFGQQPWVAQQLVKLRRTHRPIVYNPVPRIMIDQY